MPISDLTLQPSIALNPKLAKASSELNSLLTAIAHQTIPAVQEQHINEIIAGVNNLSPTDPKLLKKVKTAQTNILDSLEQELKIVPKNRYRRQWLALGMAAFGIPLGIAFGTAIGNLAFLSIGLPIGFAIGIGIGTSKDKQAKEEGRQLDWPAE